jgi:hypothetical protein
VTQSLAKRIFQDAIELDGADRARFLERECAFDDVLRDQVQSLLDALRAADGLLENLPGPPRRR